MSVVTLVTGKLIAGPGRRTGANVKPLKLARLAAVTDEGDSLVSVIASGSVGEQLETLNNGDASSLTGRAKIPTPTDRGCNAKAERSVTAYALPTAYNVRRTRQARLAERLPFMSASLAALLQLLALCRFGQSGTPPKRASHRRALAADRSTRRAVCHKRVTGARRIARHRQAQPP